MCQDIAVRDAKIAQLEEELRELGVCVKCLEVPEMDADGPFSCCPCGTSEDYGKRPLQKLQLLERSLESLMGF